MNRKISQKLSLYSITGFLTTLLGVLVTEIILSIYGISKNLDYRSLLLGAFFITVAFAVLFALDIPLRWIDSPHHRKATIKHLTFLNNFAIGLHASYWFFTHLPGEIAALPTQFLCAVGIIYFHAAAANMKDVLFYGSLYIFFTFLMSFQFGDFGTDEKYMLLTVIFQMLCFLPIVAMANGRIKAIRHAFRQLEKVFYPHQINSIKRGADIEQTMPTHTGEACVICLDIIRSSKIQHVRSKEFFRNYFRRCNAAMMEQYKIDPLQARGYRIKEMGDGFLCSVGYPFLSPEENITEGALLLALDFQKILEEESRILELDEPIHCCISVVLEQVTGFYPGSGTKEYDLFGRGIVLATRYEGLRNQLFPRDSSSSLIILQERVYQSLGRRYRPLFNCLELNDFGVTIRDDAAAERVFVRRLINGSESELAAAG